MSPAALADLIGQFIRHVGNFLSWDFVERLQIQTAAPPGEIEAAHNKRMDARDAVRDAGRQLTWELAAARHNAKDVLLLLHCLDGGGGARKVRQLWPQTKVDLQELAIRLQTGGRTMTGRAEGDGADGSGRRRKRGRPSDTDPQADRRIFEAWQTRRYRTYDELARELNITKRTAKLAIDRTRQRNHRRQAPDK